MENQQGSFDRLNWQQACALLGCGKSTLYRLVARGVLHNYGIGKRRRWYRREECEQLLRAEHFLDKNSLKS